eukprot:CAMPEP_0119317244 /NCGR_PEP_ID=MMETSP1333-20130426/42494_1 /TAXON_ID=418940 /ORGANISM="Scyphosphaera apsteinii, Strain RCC1455" /LENGTH=199 /DNA_ID=CAMNT_0007323123 /DNA_START=36 /DNA_END=635 /DNA_ORIENTATION=-
MADAAPAWDLGKELKDLKELQKLMGWPDDDPMYRAQLDNIAKKNLEMTQAGGGYSTTPVTSEVAAVPSKPNKKRKAEEGGDDVPKKRDEIPWGVLLDHMNLKAKSFKELKVNILPKIFGHTFVKDWKCGNSYMYGSNLATRRYRPKGTKPGSTEGLLLRAVENEDKTYWLLADMDTLGAYPQHRTSGSLQEAEKAEGRA